MKKTILSAILCMAFGYRSNAQTTVTLNPVADADISTMGGGIGNKPFLKFDISSIPLSAVISSATLQVYVTSVNSSWDGDVNFYNVNSQTWTPVNQQTTAIVYTRTDSTYQGSAFGTSLGWSNSVNLKNIVNKDHLASNQFCTVFMWDPDDVTFAPGFGTMRNLDTLGCGNGSFGQTIFFASVDHANTTIHPKLIINYAFAPTANFNIAASACSGSALTFTDTSVNSPTSWNWSMPGASVVTSTLQNPSVTYSAAGVYTVTLLAANASGTNTISKTITVTATPTLAVNNSTICSGSLANLTVSGASTYSWSTGAITASVAVSPTVNTTYTVIGNNGACSATKSVNVIVNAVPSLSLSTSLSVVCTASTGGANISLTGTPPGGIFSGTGVVGSTFTAQANTGTFVPVYSYTNSLTGCANSVSVSIVVNSCTGLLNSNLQTAMLTVHPNPSSGLFRIETESNENYTLWIYDMTGKLIEMSGELNGSHDYNLLNYPSGIYNLTIKLKNGESQNRKLIVTTN